MSDSPSSGSPSLDSLSLESRHVALSHFVAEVRARLDGPRPNLGPNQVEVSPGGKTFATIGEALASITDASQKKQYVCYIGPGTYQEVVVCKPWVFLQGEGQDQTILAGAPSSEPHPLSSLVGASNSAIQNMTVKATSRPGPATFTVAVSVNGAINFDIENCLVLSDDHSNSFTWALVIDLGPFGSGTGSAVNIAYSSVIAQTSVPNSLTLGMTLSSGSLGLVTESKIASKGDVGNGAQSTGNSQLTLYSSYVEGKTYALTIPDEASVCIANQCEIHGPVGDGVVVNP